jgi:biofilm PGA synthesis N-glycosyltransferase PgaC
MRSDQKGATFADIRGGQRCNLVYVLITPARNEEAFMEQTIKSVVGQTVRPLKWVIVSDGSTDGTDDIVKEYAAEHRWIEFVRMQEHRDRNFAAKVACFNAGYERIRNLNYDVIGNLDADISFEPDYFEFLLGKFAETPELGVAGTPFVEGSFQYNYAFVSIEHVSGACQLFRRRCFEEVSGYMPIRGGGIDWVAVTTARMKGWKTRTFTERTCLHHRKIGSGKARTLVSKFKVGQQDYYLGGHLFWEVFRSLYQMRFRPYLAGGLFIFIGYVWALLRGIDKPISEELVRFRRREQMQRLRNLFSRAVRKLS